MKLDHIGFKLVMTDAQGIQQLDFINKRMYSVPKRPGQVYPVNTQLPPPSFFRWGISQERLCKLFIKNYGTEDVQYKVDPRDDSDAELVSELDANDSRDIDFLTVGAIDRLNLKVMGPGSTTIRIDGYILYS